MFVLQKIIGAFFLIVVLAFSVFAVVSSPTEIDNTSSANVLIDIRDTMVTVSNDSAKIADTLIQSDTIYSDIEVTGLASWYGSNGVPGIRHTDNYHGKTTANGEKFNTHALTAAIKTALKKKFGLCHLFKDDSLVKVTNLSNGKSVVVRLTDTGPLASGRVIDLSWAAKTKIGAGSLEKVRVEKIQIK